VQSASTLGAIATSAVRSWICLEIISDGRLFNESGIDTGCVTASLVDIEGDVDDSFIPHAMHLYDPKLD
jgi:hypothetical protein